MKKVAACILAISFAVGSAMGQIAPLHVGNTNSLTDEFGQLLQGTDPGAPSFGQIYVEGDLIQIVRIDPDAGNYIVHPPGTNGLPSNPYNEIIQGGRIGHGVDPTLGPVGKFGTAIPNLNRSALQPIKLVARVFNAPSLEQASFYQDSDVYDAANDGSGAYSVFIAQFTNTSTTRALDNTDHDGDGLSRSWEISYGSNADNPDTDGDGMADGHEVRAGTGLTDPASLLLMVQIAAPPGSDWNEDEGMFMSTPSDLILTWDAVTGKTYQIEFTTNDLNQNPVFADINEAITATGAVAQTVVTNGLSIGATHFRVRLVE